MKAAWLVVVFPALCLGACSLPKADGEADSPEARGRFAGIGIYSADRMWSQIAGADAAKSPAAARLEDDQEVIVVVDSRTGEIRQCGNLSGYCVRMSPWSRNLSNSQNAPLSLEKHVAELNRASSEAADAAAAASDARTAEMEAKAQPKR